MSTLAWIGRHGMAPAWLLLVALLPGCGRTSDDAPVGAGGAVQRDLGDGLGDGLGGDLVAFTLPPPDNALEKAYYQYLVLMNEYCDILGTSRDLATTRQAISKLKGLNRRCDEVVRLMIAQNIEKPDRAKNIPAKYKPAMEALRQRERALADRDMADFSDVKALYEQEFQREPFAGQRLEGALREHFVQFDPTRRPVSEEELARRRSAYKPEPSATEQMLKRQEEMHEKAREAAQEAAKRTTTPAPRFDTPPADDNVLITAPEETVLAFGPKRIARVHVVNQNNPLLQARLVNQIKKLAGAQHQFGRLANSIHTITLAPVDDFDGLAAKLADLGKVTQVKKAEREVTLEFDESKLKGGKP